MPARKRTRNAAEKEGSGAPIVFAYWAIRGLAQPIRLLLEYTGQPYTDKRAFSNPSIPGMLPGPSQPRTRLFRRVRARPRSRL
jgi:hypothetical protein